MSPFILRSGRVLERQRILLGATAISLLHISAELAAQPAPPPDIQPAPAASPANETAAPSAAPSTPPSTPAETPPEARKPLPTISVTTERPKQPVVAPTGKPAQSPSRPAAGRPAPAQAAPAAPSAAQQAYETGSPNVAGGAASPPQLASQMTVSGEDINARPMTRPGEVVEAAPGLMAIMHSEGGKANQYYLRGWDLDQGTDFATFVDDVPINLPSHVHGQGYTDLNWLIPETVNGVDIRKGPYFADVGDFTNAGNLHISFRDAVERNIEQVTVGSFGYDRVLLLGSSKLDSGSLLYAGAFNLYNGPWTNPDNLRSFSGLARYSQGTATDGVSLTAQAYANNWNAADQVPLRALATGQIGLLGQLDPTDGGDTSRFSLSARWAQSDAIGLWKANAYAVAYSLNLFNNLEWFTPSSIPTPLPNNNTGDQFHQHESRIYTGGGVSRTIDGTLWGLPNETLLGAQTRYDGISDSLSNTFQRQFLFNTLVDKISEGNVGIYAQNTMHWTDWFKTTAGWRGDAFATSVNSTLQPANSGHDEMMIGSPKFTAALGPFYKTELFLGAGMGYHSNDARGTVISQVPGDPTTPQNATPLLVRSRGGEVGIRTKAIPNLDSSVSFFYLRQNSELFFSGDSGTTTAGPPSQRTGIEFTNDYRLSSWLHADANVALSRARFLGFDNGQEAFYQSLAGFPQVQIGNAPGNYVFNAPWMVASAGVTLGDRIGWYSSLRWRYISSRPLTEDGVFQSPPFNIINGSVGYRFDNGWHLDLAGLNLLNSSTDLATFAYGSVLNSDSLFALCYPIMKAPAAVCQTGIMDHVFHPIEPLAVRVTLGGPLETLDPARMAADLRHSIPEYQAPAPLYDWTGFHIGAHVSETSFNTSGSAVNGATGAPVAPGIVSASDWHAGIQLGYDYMMPSRVVIGISADVSSGSRKTVTTADSFGTSAYETNVFDSETVLARLGYAVDNILLYGTGGLAWSNNQYIRTQLAGTLNLATPGTEEAVNKYLSGWTAGGGIAFAFEQNWNVFAEYRHTSYGSSTNSLPFSGVSTTSKTDVNEVEFGVNYKFNWGAPPSGRFALATNLGRPVPVYKAPVYKALSFSQTYNWTGVYVGGDAGYAWAPSSGTLTTAAGVPLDAYDFSVSGTFAGAFIGANYQFDRFVLGAEGDWQGSNLIGNSQASSSILMPAGTFPGGPFTISTTIKDYGSIRARFGFAFDRFLLFGTAGAAWGNPSNAYALYGAPPFLTHGGIASGWTVGAGLDYAFTNNAFGTLEYRYTNLGAAGFVNAATDSGDIARRVAIGDVRAGLAYKFDGSSLPLFARF
jgi:opacity protein-like surface antigen/outer membrane receptor protein involved in Fe transport